MTSIHPSLSSSRSGSSASVHSIANTVLSTAPLTAAYRPPPKDYAAAFANLQAHYGMSGDFPGRVAQGGPPKKKQRKPPPPSRPSTSSGQPKSSKSTGPSLDAHDNPLTTPAPGRVDGGGDSSSSKPDAATGDEPAPGEGAPREGKEKLFGVAKLRKVLRLRPQRNK
ncbi:hypothetical protein DFH08DRAFT_833778 [Mycena albidolilacea]|uniref:Uncharacterized protein n=1 Tax=Mycena albidolilacea TaxID=1033008 RepID=A0AAD7AQT6_9AGAR|nr:hypothetical protein DFH08DRAFT_833778 [Mycena albidolilacea]